MKKILTVTAVAALIAGVSVYAANPFSDVSTDDWAYQAVSDLSDQGGVEGYPDGTFKGERNMTRYELAQVIARLMAREDQLNAEQRVTLDKLAGEYADELVNLGVRVSNLEKKVGNISWSGDSRMRYKHIYNTKEDKNTDGWDGNFRLVAKAQVNDSTYIWTRFLSWFDFKTGVTGSTSLNRLVVNHKFSDTVDLSVGRLSLDMSSMGCWIYSDAFDGAQLSIGDKNLKVSVGYGKFRAGYDIKNKDALYARLAANTGVASVGVDYYKLHEGNKEQVLGGNFLIPVGDFRVFGDYYKADKADARTWLTGVGYGKLNSAKAGTWQLDVAYVDAQKGVFQGGSGWHTNMLDHGDVRFWQARGRVALMKNVYLHGEYGFAAHAKKAEKEPSDVWTLSLNYDF